MKVYRLEPTACARPILFDTGALYGRCGQCGQALPSPAAAAHACFCQAEMQRMA